MNLFVLHPNHQTNAEYHVDRHVCKLVIESAQILCTAQYILDSHVAYYKPTHINHPIAKWARLSRENYIWVCKYGMALCKEYTHRYCKRHACEDVIAGCYINYPKNFPVIGLTKFVLAMPQDCQVGNPVDSYREYYNRYKRHLFKWTNRAQPDWIR